jgi:RNA-directed DNA polymerase
MTVMRAMMSKLELTVNETKMRLCHLPDESYDFLGYTLGRNYDCRTGESDLGPRPSRKKIDRLCREFGEMTMRKMAGRDVRAQVGRISSKLKGRSNYFRIGTVSKAYRSVDSHVRHRVRQWLCVKFKVRGHGKKRFHDQHLEGVRSGKQCRAES